MFNEKKWAAYDRGIWATPEELDKYLEDEGFILEGDETEDKGASGIGTAKKGRKRIVFKVRIQF